MPIGMDCFECGGTGIAKIQDATSGDDETEQPKKKCPHCNHGEIEITECPLKIVDYETWQFVEYASLYLDHGLPPVGGGSLDQTVWFISAAYFVSGEIKHIKRQLGILDG